MAGQNRAIVSQKCVSMFMHKILEGELLTGIFKFMLAVLEIQKQIVIFWNFLNYIKVGGPKARFTVDQAILTPLHLLNLPEVVKNEI